MVDSCPARSGRPGAPKRATKKGNDHVIPDGFTLTKPSTWVLALTRGFTFTITNGGQAVLFRPEPIVRQRAFGYDEAGELMELLEP